MTKIRRTPVIDEIEIIEEAREIDAHDMTEFPEQLARELWEREEQEERARHEEHQRQLESGKNTIGEIFSFQTGAKISEEEIQARIQNSLAEAQDKELDQIIDDLCQTSCAFFCQEVLTGSQEYGDRFFISEHHQQWDELIQQHDRLCVLAPRDHGKCGTGEELLLTPEGKRIQLVDWKGGELIAFDEKTKTLIQTYAPPVRENGKKQTLKIKLRSGREIRVTENHPFYVKNKGWVQAQDLFRQDKIAIVKKYPENIGTQHVQDPWLLGLLLGDGKCQGTAILATVFDAQVLHELKILTMQRNWAFRTVDNGLNWQIGIPNGQQTIKWKMEHHKKIPPYVFLAQAKYIKEFLAGYLDSNGHFDLELNGAIEMYSTNKELLQDMQHLFSRIGVPSRLATSPRRLRIEGEALRLLDEQVRLRSYKRHTLKTMADAQHITSNDGQILFDQVDEILPNGDRMTYALSVPEHCTYCANEIINHNTYFFDYGYPLWKATTMPGSIGYIFSATAPQAERILEDIKDEIIRNPELRYLKPDVNGKHNRWSARYIRLTNGSRIYARGFGTKVRGAHPHWLVVDDGLNDETIYSETTRKKEIEYFKTAISNMIVPGGQIIVVGTPFHAQDLYADLAENEEYHFAKYQAIDKNEQALWPERYDKERLEAKKREIGSICFTREFLCEPIADDMSLFPKSLFRGQQVEEFNLTLGMEKKFWEQAGISIYMGVDFALSSSVQADFTVIWTMGVDGFGNRWIIDIQRQRGLPYQEQLSLINQVARKYEPGLIFLEANQMQRIFGEELIRTSDLPIKQFTTGVEKHSLEKGVPSLRVLLENAKFRIPRGDARAIELTDIWIDEMNCFTWHDGKLQSVGGHDDMVMACWICDQAIRRGGFSFTFGEEEDDGLSLDEFLAKQMGEEPQSEEQKREASLVDNLLL